jgi:DNA-binding MarR family transcriptional regulator
MEQSGADRQISLLFDVFVVNQRLRALLAQALTDEALRPDEYAVYSVLYEHGTLTPTEMATALGMPVTTTLDYLRAMDRRGHTKRTRNPADGRSYRVSLTMDGLAAHQRTHAAWEVAVQRLEGALGRPVREVRAALHALDDAASAALALYHAEKQANAG